MGFYIRKSVKVGPLRFNLSKSGIGLSAGVKGLRFGARPKGNYIHMGRHGLYYRAAFSNISCKRNSSITPSVSYDDIAPEDTTHCALEEIESGDVLAMKDSSSSELLEELNSKCKKTVMWPFPIIIGIISILLAFKNELPTWVIGLIVLATFVVSFFAYYKDQIRKCVVLFYNLEPDVEAYYKSLHDAFEILKGCSRGWHIEAKGSVRDKKYHAGASSLVKRKLINFLAKEPPNVKTNLTIPSLPVGRQTLYFFPDRLLVFDSKGVGAVPYESLQIEVSQNRFIEEDSVPNESEVIGRTWKYVNKKGGPDRRFKDNRELPIVMYEQLFFSSPTGLNEVLQFSRLINPANKYIQVSSNMI